VPTLWNFSVWRSFANRQKLEDEMLCVIPFVLLIASLSYPVLSWESLAKGEVKAEGCPHLQKQYASIAGQENVSARCPLKDNCPLYAAVVGSTGDSAEVIKSLDIDWSIAVESVFARVLS
jgi:hypothetical protein